MKRNGSYLLNRLALATILLSIVAGSSFAQQQRNSITAQDKDATLDRSITPTQQRSLGAFAEPNEPADEPLVFFPVSQKEVGELALMNQYHVRQELFFAKRHRFVRVDHRVFLNFETFNLNFFDDLSIPVSTVERRGNLDSVVHWIGTPSALGNSGKNPLLSDDGIELPPTQIRVTGVSMDLDTGSGRAFPSRSAANRQGYPRPGDSTRMRYGAFMSFSGTFDARAISQPATYILKPVSIAPDIHILYEVDNSKTFRESAVSAGNRKHVDRYEKFLRFKESLGPDPSVRWAQRHAGELE